LTSTPLLAPGETDDMLPGPTLKVTSPLPPGDPPKDYTITVTADGGIDGPSGSGDATYTLNAPPPPACSVTFDQPSYYLGDKMTMHYLNAPVGTNVDITDKNGSKVQWANNVSGSGDLIYNILSTDPIGKWAGSMIGSCNTSQVVDVSNSTCKIDFAESTYNVGETMTMNYKYIPAGTYLSLVNPNSSTVKGWVVSIPGSQTWVADLAGTWTAYLEGTGCGRWATVVVYAAPTCVTDGKCDHNCPLNCTTAAQDPDCECYSGPLDPGKCCGIGCNKSSDDDCPAIWNPLGFGSFPDIIAGVGNFLFWILVSIASIIIIVGGFYLLTSGGDPDKVRTAKKILLYALIGLAIVLFARALIFVIKQLL
jgi:hypothetical protein